MKSIFLAIAAFAVLITSGCATQQQGAVLGGIVGNLIEDNSRGTALGAVVGAALSGHQQGFVGGAPQCRIFNGQQPVCHTGRLVCKDGNFACEHTDAGFGQFGSSFGGFTSGYQRQQYRGPMTCGPASLHMTCSSVIVEGTDCRRCQ